MDKIIAYLSSLIFLASLIVLFIAGMMAYGARFNVPGGFRIYSVLTGSMNPAIPTGSLIISKAPLSTSDISQGEIITFNQPNFRNKFITHRVYNIIKQGSVTLFQTKGDANQSPDPWRIAYGSIKGVYQIGFPRLGYFLEFLKSPLGIVIFVFIPVIIIAAIEIKNIFQILLSMKLQKEQVQENSKPNNLYLILLPLILAASVLLKNTSTTLALFESNPATITGSKISTASKFPTPTPTPCPGDTIITISGNGTGSKNTVSVPDDKNASVTQSNSTSTTTLVDISNSTGGNTSSNNTNANSIIQTGTASVSANVTISSSSNSAQIK